MTHRFTNRLIHEDSPYLAQHAHNPVDWYPWGEEALEASKRENKPILLSVGYSSCHWCHVMERQSFENEEIARMMNESFINIKVDREERPDLDSIYMTYVQMTTGHGGWPLTVFLTPDMLPFFGGTYYPPEDVPGRPGFKTILRSVAHFYRTRGHEIEKNQDQIRKGLRQTGYLGTGTTESAEDILTQAFEVVRGQFDPRNGGFGDAPKFPSPITLSFFLRFFERTGQSSALEMAQLSLEKMASGGIYDHLGGGFHRYTVDERWLIPHFEKMLYDNALLVSTYLEAYQLTRDPLYRTTIQETLSYVCRDLTSEAGGFYSAEDADSEGKEGRFYVWTAASIRQVLGERQAGIFCDFYGVSEQGNWEGTNIIHRRRDIESLARQEGLSADQLTEQLTQARQKLFEARQQRVRPGLDDKVLSSWNGLMLTAFARGGFVLNNVDFLNVARKNALLLTEKMIRNSRLFRSLKSGTARFKGYLDDYAHVVQGLLTLFQVTGEVNWLATARALTDIQIERFWDDDAGDFYFTSSDHEKLVVRPKEHFDNAIPSGNSTAVLNLLQLSEITGELRYRTFADRLLGRMLPAISKYPTAFSNWLRGLDESIGPTVEVAIVGPPEAREPFINVVRSTYLPRHVLILSDGREGEEKIPLLQGRTCVDGQAVAYVCQQFTCQEPTQSPDRLRELLEKASPRGNRKN